MIEYEELRISTWRIRRDHYLVMANGPASAAAEVRIDPDHTYRAEFSELLDEEFRRNDGPGTPVHPRIRKLGEKLFDLLFPEPVQKCLFTSAERADQHGRGLRVRFELAPELDDIPMEILWGPHPYRKLVGNPRFSLARTIQGSALSPRRLPAPTSPPEKFRVLVVVAQPRGGGRDDNQILDLDAELKALQKVLTEGPRRAAVTMETLGWPRTTHRFPRPTLANLRAELARHPEMPCAVVLLGHGTAGDGTRGGEILLEKADGSPDPIAGERLASDLATAAAVRLVVLNLCAGGQADPAAHPHSAVAHELIAKGIPAVVAMQADVSNTAATHFTPTLFTAITGNGSVDEAVAAARHDMVDTRDATTLEWATPVLMLHHQCRHSWLFKAVRVGKATVPVDPLASGQQAIDDVERPPDGAVQIDALVEASRFARLLGDWEQVVRFADMGREEQLEQLEWLAQEARLELALDQCRTICQILASEGDPDEAAALLDEVRSTVPHQIFGCLAAGIHRAARACATLALATQATADQDWASVVAYCDEILADLPEGYRNATKLRDTAKLEIDLAAIYQDAQRHRDADRWDYAELAYQHILDRRPDGYRDARSWHAYCRAQQAEADENWPAAVDGYDAAGDLADAVGRAAHCRARQAEADDSWDAAITHYETAHRHGVDVGPAPRYAAGRLAAAQGDWPRAAELFRELPEQYRDSRHWAGFAAGRAALDRQDWPGVLDALGGLTDEFHHGEVGRMRGLARAHLAAARGRWAEVVEALRGLGDDYAGVRELRATAQGHLAADRGDWPAAVEAFHSIATPTPDIAAQLTYATGRIAEADRDWAQALAIYQQVTTVRDAALRCDYVQGLAAEDVENWPDAHRYYSLLPAEFEDAGPRAGYARVRSAVQQHDWPVVFAAAEALGVYRDAPRLGLYGRARDAETIGDWSLAADLFAQCVACDVAEPSPACHDAEVRAGYAQARAAEAQGRWIVAQAVYQTLPDDHRDVLARRNRLATLLRTLRWANELGDVSLIPDPSAADHDDFPYAVLAPLGISPDSSRQDVLRAGMRALRENLDAARQAAAGLHLWRTRVDADLYPVRDPATLRRALHDLTLVEVADPFDYLCAAAPDDAPLLTLLHAGRKRAIDAWEERLRRDPADIATAHCLAIAHRWAARDLDRAGAWEHGRVAWQRCIGLWVTTLGNEAYWEQWRRARSARDDFMVPVEEIRQLRETIISDLTDEFDRTAAQHAQDDRPALAEQYHALSIAVRVEILGRDALAEVGGVASPDGSGTRVAGGPAYVRAVDLSPAVARRIAELIRSADDAQSDQDPAAQDSDLPVDVAATPATLEAHTRLCAAFSRLGPAVAMLEAGRPGRALTLLPDLHRGRLTGEQECPPDQQDAATHYQSCPTCQRFLADDPAYLHLGGRDARLLQDAARIAVQCHLKVARDVVLADDQIEIDGALHAVGAALRLASAAGLAARARRDVATFVTESVKMLLQREPAGRRHLDRAVDFVSRVRTQPGLGNDELVRSAHAETLYQRAWWIEDQDDINLDHDRAIADLREAIRLSPASLMARVGLAHTLVARSADRPRAGQHEQAIAEALTVVTEGLRAAPGHIPLLEAATKVTAHVRQVVYRGLSETRLMELEPSTGLPDESPTDTAIRLARQAARLDTAGDQVTALLMGVDAVLADPREPVARETLLTIVTRWITRSGDTGGA